MQPPIGYTQTMCMLRRTTGIGFSPEPRLQVLSVGPNITYVSTYDTLHAATERRRLENLKNKKTVRISLPWAGEKIRGAIRAIGIRRLKLKKVIEEFPWEEDGWRYDPSMRTITNDHGLEEARRMWLTLHPGVQKRIQDGLGLKPMYR